jgi:hypothetical protein
MARQTALFQAQLRAAVLADAERPDALGLGRTEHPVEREIVDLRAAGRRGAEQMEPQQPDVGQQAHRAEPESKRLPRGAQESVAWQARAQRRAWPQPEQQAHRQRVQRRGE